VTFIFLFDVAGLVVYGLVLGFNKFLEVFGFLGFYFVATLAFGLRPRQRGCKVASLVVDPGGTSHAPGSAKSAKSAKSTKSPESVRE